MARTGPPKNLTGRSEDSASRFREAYARRNMPTLQEVRASNRARERREAEELTRACAIACVNMKRKGWPTRLVALGAGLSHHTVCKLLRLGYELEREDMAITE